MGDWLYRYPVGGAGNNKFRALWALPSAAIGIVADAATSVNLSDWVFGEYTEWTRSLIYYPIDFWKLQSLNFIDNEEVPVKFRTGLVSLDAGFDAHKALSKMYDKELIYMGSFYLASHFNDYRDYEPFTSVEVYLPFYGYCTLKIADILNSTVHFNLVIDWFTGAGLYYVTSGDSPYSRIIGTYSATIGSVIPMGQSGASETARNLLMGAVKGAATIAGAYYGGIAGATTVRSVTSTSTTEDSSEAKVRNDATGRMVRASSSSGTSETTTNTLSRQVSNRWKRDVIESCFSTAAQVVSNFQFHPSVDKANNPAVDCGGATEIHVIIRRSRFIPTDSNYAHLYGFPLGKVMQLSDVHDYTECSAIHLEGPGFSSATSAELNMISDIMSGGVILP